MNHETSIVRNVFPHTLVLSDEKAKEIWDRAEADSSKFEGIERHQEMALSIARQKREMAQ